MDPISGGQASQAALYEVLAARRAQTQQQVDGAAVLKLLEAARVTAPARGLPMDATISIRA